MSSLSRSDWARIAVVAAVTICVILYTLVPYGLGGWLFTICATACIVSMAVGPLARHVEWRIWGNAASGGIAFLLGLVCRLLPLPTAIGPLSWADIFCFLGYAFLAAWLAGLLRRVGEPRSGTTILDTSLITIGAALALWTITISPALLKSEDLGGAMVSATYPVLDIVLVTLSAQLIFRIRVRVHAMWAFMSGLIILQVLDTAYTVVWAFSPRADVPGLTALFLYAYLCFAFGMCHPSIVELSHSTVDPSDGISSRQPGRRGAILLFLVTPAIVSIVSPMNGSVDSAVRAFLVTALFTLLFLRLSSAMSSLFKAEAESRFRSLHDPLTGLLNREAFADRLGERLRMNSPEEWLYILFIDCDNFKSVNDTWGHPIGDALLCQVATRLRNTFGQEDVLARLGGDEFVLAASRKAADQAERLAELVMASFNSPLELSGQQLTVTPSIGISVCQVKEGRQEEIIWQADIALYAAKERGRAGWAVFDDALRNETEYQRMLVEDLGNAIGTSQIRVDFQPIYGKPPSYDKIVGWEALARWLHPEKGWIDPRLFISVAEQTGLITELGMQILQLSCSELSRLRAESGRDDLHVAVNFSPLQLMQETLVRGVSDTLRHHRLPCDALWLEVTESTVVGRGPQLVETLRRISGLGVRVCVDDFGTGYSSLAVLRDLPVDLVKLDRLFVTELATDARARAITSTIVELTAALHVRGVIAEGVETLEQAAILAEVGTTMVQGWLYGKPIPADETKLLPTATMYSP